MNMGTVVYLELILKSGAKNCPPTNSQFTLVWVLLGEKWPAVCWRLFLFLLRNKVDICDPLSRSDIFSRNKWAERWTPQTDWGSQKELGDGLERYVLLDLLKYRITPALSSLSLSMTLCAGSQEKRVCSMYFISKAISIPPVKPYNICDSTLSVSGNALHDA